MSYDIIVIRYHSFANVSIIYNNVLINVFNANIIIVHGSRPVVPCREVVSRIRNERSSCPRVDTGNWARTGRDRSRPVRKSVVWTRPKLGRAQRFDRMLALKVVILLL